MVALLAPAGLARGETNDAAETIYRRAEADDARGAYALALSEYEEAIRKLPSGAFVPKAHARAETLKSHAEGDFVPFSRLERLRRDPRLSSEPESLTTLLGEASSFGPGLVRGEARMLVAEAYAGRLHRTRDAIAVLELVVHDPSADPLTARLAVRMLVDAHLATGNLDAAASATRENEELSDKGLIAKVAGLVRRRTLHRAATLLLVSAGLLAAIAIARAARRGLHTELRGALTRSFGFAAAFCGYIAIGGTLLASGYTAETAAPFLAFGGALLPIVLVARTWAAAGSPRTPARALRAAICGITVVCAGFLVLEWVDTSYLESFGL